jgi:hypothetical protein
LESRLARQTPFKLGVGDSKLRRRLIPLISIEVVDRALNCKRRSLDVSRQVLLEMRLNVRVGVGL